MFVSEHWEKSTKRMQHFIGRFKTVAGAVVSFLGRFSETVSTWPTSALRPVPVPVEPNRIRRTRRHR